MRINDCFLFGGCFLIITAAGCSRTSDATPLPLAPVRAEADPAPAGPESFGVAFAEDEGGKLALQRLTSHQTSIVEPAPFVTAPKPWRSATLERQLALPLTPIDAPPASHVAGKESSLASRPRPALDVPPLASADTAPFPARVEMTAGPKAFAYGPDPLAPSPLISVRLPERPSAADDPTAEASRQATLTIIELLRSQAAPFIRLVIPDPFENAQTARLRNMPPENDPPAAPAGRPPLPPLPAK